jgi:D-alanyl-D-alanine-carboxypeptidase/D-alanyl-D-alanine-endopeptidase
MQARWLIFLWFGVFPLSALAANPPVADTALRDLARAWLLENNGVGLSIGVYDTGKRQFVNAGSTRVDSGKTPTPQTIYEVGGISKVFTGQLLARAIVEGRAAPSDDVEQYLGEPYPNLGYGDERVRLLTLANTTSGLANNIPDVSQVRTLPNEPLAATRMRVFVNYSVAQFRRDLHLVRPRLAPGAEPGASNVSSMLLGLVLEKIYGEPFDVTLTREIEKPLRMANGTQPDFKLLARGYTSAGEELPTFGARIAWPSMTLRYSASDLLEFAAWQMAERDASVKLAHKPTWTTLSGAQSIGYFWIVGTSPQGRRVHMVGSSYGFASMCDLYPDSKLAIVLLANKEGAQDTLRALSSKIAETLRPIKPTS